MKVHYTQVFMPYLLFPKKKGRKEGREGGRQEGREKEMILNYSGRALFYFIIVIFLILT